MICEKITCKRTRKILYTIIFSCPGNGLLIGLYSSQVLGVFYLYKFEHYCKETLKIKYLYIYMDDIVVLSNSKDKLHAYHKYISNYLNKNLHLELKDNYAFFPIEKRRLDFMGYVFNHNNVIIRKRTKINFKRNVNQIVRTINKGEQLPSRLIKSYRSSTGNFDKWLDDKTIIENAKTKINKALAERGFIND